MSGEPLFEESTKVLIMARKILNNFGSPISIIATGGVYDGKSAYIKILCGADLIQLYTGLVYKGPFVVKNILDQIDRYRKRDNIKNWVDVRGLAKSIKEANKIVENGLNKKIQYNFYFCLTIKKASFIRSTRINLCLKFAKFQVKNQWLVTM